MTFLPVQRQVIAILRGDDVGQKPRAGQAFLAGLSGLDISTTDKDRARANAEAAGCLAGEDLVMICGMRLRLV
jgi:hypothetical protein